MTQHTFDRLMTFVLVFTVYLLLVVGAVLVEWVVTPVS